MKELKDMKTAEEINKYFKSDKAQREIKEVEDEIAAEEAEDDAKANSDETFSVPEIPFSDI